jgi:hypothetical protein
MATNSVIVSPFSLNYVLSHEGKTLNTNNHFIADKRPKPDDYVKVIDRCKARYWIHNLHDVRHVVDIKSADMAWIKEAFKSGSKLGRFPSSFQDEIYMIHQGYGIPDGKWFVRTDMASLKYGVFGVGPYSSIEPVITSMITTTPEHPCFRMEDDSCRIYLLEWKDIPIDKEFRVFVYQNQITAISDQNFTRVNDWLTGLTESETVDLVHKIKTYFEDTVREKLRYIGNYVMDIALVNDQPYFIEVNPFGKDYSSRSALFNWETDEKKLMDSSQIELRYVSIESC